MEDTKTVNPPLRLNRLFCGSLFSGIGGMDLGLERAGFELKWQVEIDPYCRRVLERHWPDVRRWDDVRTWPQPDTERVDLLCGGFPCTDISNAGRREGIEGKQSGLWSEMRRIIRELRPRVVLVENVAALLGRGASRVFGDLAEDGFDCEWACIPAAAVGAPHVRDRVFVVANAGGWRWGKELYESLNLGSRESAAINEPQEFEASRRRDIPRVFAGASGLCGERHQWEAEPNVGRMADGVANRVDRLRAIGNAVVPQVAEWIGRRIIAAVS